MEGTIYRVWRRLKDQPRAGEAPRDHRRQEAMVIPVLKGQKEGPLVGSCSHQSATAQKELGHQQRSTAPAPTQSSWDTIIHPTLISSCPIPTWSRRTRQSGWVIQGKPTSGTHTHGKEGWRMDLVGHICSLLPSEEQKYIILQLSTDTL